MLTSEVLALADDSLHSKGATTNIRAPLSPPPFSADHVWLVFYHAHHLYVFTDCPSIKRLPGPGDGSEFDRLAAMRASDSADPSWFHGGLPKMFFLQALQLHVDPRFSSSHRSAVSDTQESARMIDKLYRLSGPVDADWLPVPPGVLADIGRQVYSTFAPRADR